MLLKKIIQFRMDSQPDLWIPNMTTSIRMYPTINIAPSYSTKKQNEAVHALSRSLCELWIIHRRTSYHTEIQKT